MVWEFVTTSNQRFDVATYLHILAKHAETEALASASLNARYLRNGANTATTYPKMFAWQHKDKCVSNCANTATTYPKMFPWQHKERWVCGD